MKKTLLGIIIGMILCGSIVYAASIYNATDISYNNEKSNVKNVNDALDSLYNNVLVGDAKAEDILEGKTALVQGNLVTGTMKEPKIVHGTKSGTASAGEEINVGYKPQYIYLKCGKSTGTNTYYNIYIYYIPIYNDSVCITTRTNSTIGSNNTTISYVNKEVDISTYFTLTDTGFITSTGHDSYTYTVVY